MLKRLTHAAAVAALAGIVAGCAGRGLPDDATPRTELTSWCSAYAGLMQTAADVRSEMGATARETVEGARTVAGPICTDIDAVANEQTALTTVTNAVERLRQVPAIKEEVNR